jgi:hypothetical protein
VASGFGRLSTQGYRMAWFAELGKAVGDQGTLGTAISTHFERMSASSCLRATASISARTPNLSTAASLFHHPPRASLLGTGHVRIRHLPSPRRHEDVASSP